MHNFNFIVHVIDSGLLMKYFFLHAFKVATGSFVASGRCLNQNVMHCVFSLFDDHHHDHIVVHLVNELHARNTVSGGKNPIQLSGNCLLQMSLLLINHVYRESFV